MRMVIFGAGAVGSVIGGRLFQHQAAHGHQITLVARSSHCDAIRANGLTINDPSGTVSLAVPVVEHISQIEMTPDDVVILTMKTQDTAAALEQLARHAPIGVKVACAQNGVENERMALRRFGSVYGICVLLPAMYTWTRVWSMPAVHPTTRFWMWAGIPTAPIRSATYSRVPSPSAT